MQQKQKVIERKQGKVVVLNIEIPLNLAQDLELYSEKFRMTKADIVSQALIMWKGAVGYPSETEE